MLELLQKRMSLFGDPGVFLLPDRKKGNYKASDIVDYSTYRGLENSLEINSKQPMGMFFTPNGNYGKFNSAGEKCKRTNNDGEDYIAAVYIDLDKRHSSYKDKTDKEYFDYIKDEIDKSGYTAQYIVKSGGGYHLYSFLLPTERYEAGKALKKDWVLLQNSLASIFDGGDPSSHSYNKLMRLPFGKHWKNATPIDTELYRIDKELVDGKRKLTFVKCTKPDDIYLPEKMLSVAALQSFIQNQKPVKAEAPKGETYRVSALQINQLNIVEVIQRLEKYPRTNSLGQQVIFKTDGTRIWFKVDGQLVETDGYKINKTVNYVNNFSLEEHPREERPAGPVYVFLLNYFYKDMQKMADFLKAEFDIDFFTGDSIMKLNTDKGVICFNSDGVYYMMAKEGEETSEKLFDSPFIIKGAVKTNFEKNGESEEKNLYTIIELLDRGEDEPENMIIDFKEDRKKFNHMYGKKGLTFLKGEFYLLDFYSAIKKAVKEGVIKQYDYLYLNGYYPHFYLEGDTMYDTKGDKVDVSKLPIILNTQDVIRCEGTKQISMGEFGEKLRKLYTDRESMVAYITFLALAMGDKFWKPLLNGNEQQVLLPALFLAGITKSGKSTLINLMLNGFGLGSDCKKYSVKGTTLQPLKQGATDDFITHREEFTGNIGQERETVIRDVLNKGKTARGLIDGSNLYYIYRASLIIDGENLPESESVINRCVCIPMTLQDRIGTQELIRGFSGLTFKRDFLQELYNIDVRTVKKDFQDAQDRCIKNGIQDRNSMIYAFLLCVNQWFGIYLEPELIAAIKENLDLSASVDNTQSALSTLLSDLITKNKIRPSQYDTETGYKIVIPVPRDVISTRKFDIVSIIKQYGDRVRMEGANLIIYLDAKDESDENKSLYNTVVLFKSSFINTRMMDFD